jgi:hypothetical protein
MTFTAPPTTIDSGNLCGTDALTGVSGTDYILLNGVIVTGCDPRSLDDSLAETMARPATLIAAAMGGVTFTPGTYYSTALSTAASTTVTLDGLDQMNPVFLFQSGSTLVTGASTHFILINGARPENILWAVTAAVTTGASTVLEGSIMAGAAVNLGAGTEVRGCILAIAAVTFGAGCSIN